jgi:hypothetical protein
LKSQHASNARALQCVTCHGRYDVGVPSEEMFIGTSARQCGSCHAPNSTQGNIIRSLFDEITGSAKTVDKAQAAIDRAAGSALIVAPEEVKLREARTSLITARAAQHTLNLDLVKEKTGSANIKSQQVITDAERG